MAKDFSKIRSFWGNHLQNLPPELINGTGLDAETRYFLEKVGLPRHLKKLNRVLELNFYFGGNIKKQELDGIDYLIIGDDLGTKLCISLNDGHFYSVDFEKQYGAAHVCFINSSIDRFIETVQVFIEFEKLSENKKISAYELITSMKEQMKAIDEKSIAREQNWWSMIIHDPIAD
jgi:hypothetical protein